MLSRFWRRLGKFGLIFIVAYLFFAYALLITIIFRQELQILDVRKAIVHKTISVFNPNKELCTLHGQVRNVFGDPVPHAVLLMGDYLVQADNTGTFFLEKLIPGRYTLEIFAGGYAKYQREIQLEIGSNNPTIKYEMGLWPQVFLVDFHIYYKENEAILGIVGFANGSTEEIYIQRATLLDPQGEVLSDLLHDRDGFSYYLDLSNKLEVVEEPQLALKWPPQMVQGGEFAPIKGSFKPGPYSLEVHYAFREGHELGQYQVLTITDHLDLDSDQNPHLP